MIRPSALPLARHCLHASLLAEKYPEESEHSAEGKALHKEISNDLTGVCGAASDEAISAVQWVRSLGEVLACELRLTLDDPLGGIVTTGTADALVGENADTVIIVDWKRGFADVVDPDDNLQLLAYGEAAAGVYNKKYYRPVVYKLATKVKLIGRLHRIGEHFEEIEQLATASEEARREPHPGQHCTGCYQRRYCHAWQATEREALAVIGDKATELTADTAPKLYERIKAVKDALDSAETIFKDYVQRGGVCELNGKIAMYSTVKGRDGINKEALEADGLLAKYTKKGSPHERLTWKKKESK